MEEISRGDTRAAKRRIESVSGFPLLEVVSEVRTLADSYFTAIDVPEKARADSYHLALAAWHGYGFFGIMELYSHCKWKSKEINRGSKSGQGDKNSYYMHTGRNHGGIACQEILS